MMCKVSRKQRATAGFYAPLLREALHKVVRKKSCGTSLFCIQNNTVPVFAKNASYIDSSVRFSPMLLLVFLRNKPSSYRTMTSPTKKQVRNGRIPTMTLKNKNRRLEHLRRAAEEEKTRSWPDNGYRHRGLPSTRWEANGDCAEQGEDRPGEDERTD